MPQMFFMAARQLSLVQAIMFWCCLDLNLFSPPNLRDRLVTQIYEIRLEIWVAPSSEIWRPKNMKFRRNFGQLRDLNANIFGMQQATVNRKTALQTTGIPAEVHLIWCTLVHKR